MLTSIVRSMHGDERGQMAFTMILTLLVVFLFFALAFDAGLWYLDHRNAQNEADAAALAGALELPDPSAATVKAQAWLTQNGASLSDATVTVPPDNSYVRVQVRRDAPGVFAVLSGINAVKISASATAKRIAQPVPYSLMAMDPSACGSFYLNGNALINVQGSGASAGTYTRSNCSTAITISGGNGVLKAQGNNDEVGGATGNCTSGAQCTPVPTPQDYLDDPFAGVPVPPLSFASCPKNVKVNSGATLTLNPGCYDGLQVLGTLKLNPGVYVLTGGLSTSGNTAVVQSVGGVLFYVTCGDANGLPKSCNGANPTQFTTSGQATFSLQGMPGHPAYENLTIFVDRTAGPAIAVDITGNGSSTMTGGIYAISSGVRITGNGGTLNLQIAVVANTLEFKGNGTVNVTYDTSLIPPEYKLALTE